MFSASLPPPLPLMSSAATSKSMSSIGSSVIDEIEALIDAFDRAYKEALESEIQEAATLHDPN